MAGAAQHDSLAIHRLSVRQYHRMIEEGILGENDRVELLDGWIVSKMTHKPRHDACISLIKDELERCLPQDWMLRIQSAITLRKSEPEPDVAVVRRPARRYCDAHPRANDIAMLIEVADSSPAEDREFKSVLFARERIAAYWIVNLIDEQVEVYSEPRGGKNAGYRRREDYRARETIFLEVAGHTLGELTVADLLP